MREPKRVIEDGIGQVKFFKGTEGYGFLKVFEPEGKPDVFFHINDYDADVVHKDWWMEFDAIETRKGLKATRLRRVSQPSESDLFGTNFNY